MPTLKEEKKLWGKGYQYVIGFDEAGKGPLAGPVVAGVVMVKNSKLKTQNSNLKLLSEIKDSKQLTPKKREEFYKILTNHSAIEWGVGIVSEKMIDKVNIKNATELAMKKALDNLNSKTQILNFKQTSSSKLKNSKVFLLIDGNHISNLQLKTCHLQLIVKGDEKVFSCAAASIIAKVTRDKIMEKMDKIYPQYGFQKHKGYGTKLHFEMIKKYGPCKIHRKTFKPIKRI